MPGEFEIIQRYFTFSEPTPTNGLELSVGDDAAVLALSQSKLVVATDTLVEGVHFLRDTPAEHIATRALAVNLSDFAAMGVKPKWFSLALTLPNSDEVWLAAFSKSLAQASRAYAVSLIGGDTCRGPLNISITMIGESSGQYLTRSGAAVGDDLWVSGELGWGTAGLELLKGNAMLQALSDSENARLQQHFYAPQPQIELGVALNGRATAALDVSDGLLADALHIAERSGLGVEIYQDCIPLPQALVGTIAHDTLLQWACGGDDYQLLFTASATERALIQAMAKDLNSSIVRIGTMVEPAKHTSPVVVLDQFSQITDLPHAEGGATGYRHF